MKQSNFIKIILIFIFIMSSLKSSSSNEMEQLFQQGNDFYSNKEYIKAIDIYKRILEKGYESGDLYYNLGNAYYRIGEIGKSILNYEKSLKFLPDNENIKFNLKLARLKIKDKVNRPPEFILFRIGREVIDNLSAFEWAIVLSSAVFLVAIFFTIFSLSSSQKLHVFARRSMILFIIIAVLSVYPLYYRYKMENTGNSGIILKDEIETISAPQKGSTTLFIIHEGTKVKIIGRDNEWLKIELIDGKQGWVNAEAIGII